MKVALIGAGGMAKQHMQAYLLCEDLDVVAVADPDTQAAAECAQLTNAKTYTSIDDLLSSETLDVADICAPSFLHYEYSMKCLQHGLHVFCEKPMAHSTAQPMK